MVIAPMPQNNRHVDMDRKLAYALSSLLLHLRAGTMNPHDTSGTPTMLGELQCGPAEAVTKLPGRHPVMPMDIHTVRVGFSKTTSYRTHLWAGEIVKLIELDSLKWCCIQAALCWHSDRLSWGKTDTAFAKKQSSRWPCVQIFHVVSGSA